MIRTKAEDYASPSDKLFGVYRGVIEDNKDPEKAGRCRIRVFGIHTPRKDQTVIEGIPTDELPWAEPALGLIEGSISGFGMWSVPVQGSHAFVFFENGNIMRPIYFATVPGIPTVGSTAEADPTEGFQDPDAVYPTIASEAPLKPNALNEPDVHRLARGEILSTIVNEKKNRQIKDIPTADGNTWSEPLPFYDAQYPENIVLATHGGIIVELDNTIKEGEKDPQTGEQGPDIGKRRVHIYHPSHTFIEVSEDGDISFRNQRDRFEIVTRNRKIYILANEDKTVDLNQTVYVKKDRNIKVDRHETKTIAKDLNVEIGNEYNQSVAADKTVSVDGDETKDVGGKLEITIGADANISVGGNANLTASGVVNVSASAINLN